MITILIDHLSQAYTRGILHVQVRYNTSSNWINLCWLGSHNRRTPSYSYHSSRMRSEQDCMLSIASTQLLVASKMSRLWIQIVYLDPLSQWILCIKSCVDVPVSCKTYTSMSAYRCLCLSIRTPSKDSLLMAWISGPPLGDPFFSLGWDLASFRAWESENHGWMLMFLSYKVSRNFAGGHFISPSPRTRESRANIPSFWASSVNICHLSYRSKRQDRLISRHSRTSESLRPMNQRLIQSHLFLRIAELFDVLQRAETNQPEKQEVAPRGAVRSVLISPIGKMVAGFNS